MRCICIPGPIRRAPVFSVETMVVKVIVLMEEVSRCHSSSQKKKRETLHFSLHKKSQKEEEKLHTFSIALDSNDMELFLLNRMIY